MADLLRPVKTGGTRRYEDEFAIGNEWALDKEVDNDLDTIYNAWNTMMPPAIEAAGGLPPGGFAGGDLAGQYPNPTIRDGAVTDVKIVSVDWNKITNVPPFSAQLWIDDVAHASLIPYATRNVVASAGAAFCIGDVAAGATPSISNAEAQAFYYYADFHAFWDMLGTELLRIRPDGTVGVTTGPVAALDLATKQYVDTQFGAPLWALSGTAITPSPVADVQIEGTHRLYLGIGTTAEVATMYGAGADARIAVPLGARLQLEVAGSTIATFDANGLYLPRAVVVEQDVRGTPLEGTIDFDGTHFRGYNGTAWLNLDEAGGGTAVWIDEGAVTEMITPAQPDRGIALTGGSAGLVFRHSTYPTVDRNTGIDADDNLLQLTSGVNGIVFRGVNLSAHSLATGTGCWRLGDSATPTERLELAAGGILLGAALGTANGTLQWNGTTFQGRVGGAWVNIPGGATGALGAQNYITASATITTSNLDNVITANAANITVTLPAYSTNLGGQTFRFTRTDGQTARTVAVAAGAGDNIDGGTSITIAVGESVTLMALSTITSSKKWVTLARQNWINVTATNSITPVDSTRMLLLQGQGDACQFGSRTAKGRLISNKAADTYHSVGMVLNANYGPTGAPDDTAAASWQLLLRSGSTDQFVIQRAPPASVTPTFATFLTIDNAGKLILPGDPTSGSTVLQGSAAWKARCQVANTTSLSAMILSLNRDWLNANAQDDATKASWGIQLRTGATGDDMLIQRSPAGSTAQTSLLSLASDGKMVVTGSDPQFGAVRTGGTACRLELGEDTNGDCYITTNHPWGPQDSTKPSYMIKMAPSVGVCSFFLRLANAAAGATTEVFHMGGGDLTISGANATKASGTTWANPSDERMKRNVTNYGVGLEAIKLLRPVSFEYNGEFGTVDDGRTCYSFIAQEVQAAIPECVTTREADGMLMLDQSNIILALVNAVKELSERVSALETP